MSVIPNDLYMRGRQTMVVERYASALCPGAYADIIATSVGKADGFTNGMYKFVGTAGTANAGFTTVPFSMYDQTMGDLIIAAELRLDGFMHPKAGIETVKFSDGTNILSLYNLNTSYLGDTRCSATVNGVTNVTSIAKAFNFGANYAQSRQLGDVDSYARYNLRFRFDKNRGEFSVWLNDQLKGTAAIDSMTSFGNCTFQLIHEGYADGAEKPLYIRQIGVRLEC